MVAAVAKRRGLVRHFAPLVGLEELEQEDRLLGGGDALVEALHICHKAAHKVRLDRRDEAGALGDFAPAVVDGVVHYRVHLRIWSDFDCVLDRAKLQ